MTIPLSSNDTTEGTVTPTSLTFTPANWNVAQTVTVTGVNDNVDDGDIVFSIVTAAASGGDYVGQNASDVSVTNEDDDTRGITVSAISGNTTEAGGTATFTVVLTSEPTADVTIPLSSNDTTEGTVTPTSLTFTPANWNVAQTVTVTGVNDNLDDGDIVFSIVTAAASGSDYVGQNANDLSVTNVDDDTRGIAVSAISGNTAEGGGTARFTVVLTSEPTADVTIPLSSSDTTEGTVTPTSLTFTPANSSLDNVLELAILEALASRTLVFDGGLGKDFVKVNEAGRTLDLTNASVTLREIEGVDITGTGDNKLVISIDRVKAASSTTDTLEVVSNAGDTISFGAGWQADVPQFINGQFTHIIREAAVDGTARAEVRNGQVFTNPLNRFDVDRSGSIKALDALRIINALRRLGSGPQSLPTNDSEISDIYFDVTGEGNLTSLDALRVINALARINLGVEPEGESGSVDPGAFAKDNPQEFIDIAISEFETPAVVKSFGSVQHPQSSIATIDDWMEKLGSEEVDNPAGLASEVEERMSFGV